MTTNAGRPNISSEGGAVIMGNVVTESGDVIGRDQINKFLVQVYMLQSEEAADRYQLFSDSGQPYFPDRPFQSGDHAIFAGREQEINAIIGHLRDAQHQAIILSGPADVGKTSLLAAGVIPRLANTGALVTNLRDYAHAVPFLRAAVSGQAKQLQLNVPENASLPELVKTIVDQKSLGQILIFDQFERFFLPGVSQKEKDALRRDIGRILKLVPPRFFNIIFAVREDMEPELVRTWADLLPDLRQASIALEPLDLDEAVEAITRPFENVSRERPPYPLAYYSDKEIHKRLLIDLDLLSADQKEHILPSDLQIVCYELYEAAQGKPEPLISTELYFEISAGKGAEQIIDTHFEALMRRVSQPRRELAGKVTTAMLDSELQFWVAPEQLSLKDVEAPEIKKTMEEMVEAGLLIWHVADGKRAYAFASNSLADAALRAAGPEALKRQQARNELNYAWRSWIAYDAWASQGQLYTIKQYSGEQNFTPEKSLLLLRSAVFHDMPTTFCLDQLKTEAAQNEIRRLEAGSEVEGEESRWLTRQNQMRLMLGMNDKEHPLPERPSSEEFGAVSWTAATHPANHAVCRETAVLALLATYGGEALSRVEAAVEEAGLGRQRLAELRGILSDADEEIAKKNRGRPLPERFDVWRWRFRRRFIRDSRYIGMLTLGGAIGMGLGLSVLRALLALMLDEGSGFFFYAAFPTGFLLGGALTFGLLMADTVRLNPPLLDQPPPPEQPPEEREKRPLLLSLILGGVSFAIVHILRNLLLNARGLFDAALIPPLALVAGLGLSLAVYNQPEAGWRIGIRRWALRLSIAAVVLALVQATFILAEDFGAGLGFAWSGFFYRSRLHDTLINWGLDSIVAIENWFHWLAIIDAVLTGLAITIGLTAGLIIASEQYQKWKEREILVRQAGGDA